MRQTTKILLLPIILIWLSAVIVFYYWGHQYALIPPIIGILRSFMQLAVLGLIGVAALGLGKLFTRLIGLQFDSHFEEIVYSVGLGLGLMSLVVLGFGLLGLISRPLFWLLTLVIGSATLVWLFRDRRRNPYAASPEHESLQRTDYLFLAFIGVILVIGLLLALAPPIAWDGLSTHLVLVHDILNDGNLQPSPYSDRPIVGHLPFVWGMAIGGDALPQLLSYGQALLMVAAVAMFSQQHFGRRTAILAAAFLCSVEVFIITATWPYADVPTGMFGLLSILALVNWQLGKRTGRPWLVISVIFAVFAAHTKLNGLFVYAALALGIAIGLWWQRQDIRKRLIDVALAGIAGLVLAAIWTVVENTLKVENSTAISQISNAAVTLAATGSDSGTMNLLTRFGRFFVVIWEMTILGQQGGLNYDGTISPFFLILIPLLFLLPKKPRVVWALLIAGLVEFAAWLLVPKGYYQNRHLIMVYPIFSILAAYFISRLPELDRPSFSVSGFVRILIVLVFAIQLIFFLSWYQALDPSAYLLGLQSRDQYLSANLNGGTSPGYFSMMQVINEQLPEDSIVGVAWPEPRVYYCQRECIRYVFGRTGSPTQMAEIARAEGITHLLVSDAGLDYWIDFSQDDDAAHQANLAYAGALDSFVDQFGVLEHDQDESFYLYKLELGEE